MTYKGATVDIFGRTEFDFIKPFLFNLETIA